MLVIRRDFVASLFDIFDLLSGSSWFKFNWDLDYCWTKRARETFQQISTQILCKVIFSRQNSLFQNIREKFGGKKFKIEKTVTILFKFYDQWKFRWYASFNWKLDPAKPDRWIVVKQVLFLKQTYRFKLDFIRWLGIGFLDRSGVSRIFLIWSSEFQKSNQIWIKII